MIIQYIKKNTVVPYRNLPLERRSRCANVDGGGGRGGVIVSERQSCRRRDRRRH